jgi:hypothetical protein
LILLDDETSAKIDDIADEIGEVAKVNPNSVNLSMCSGGWLADVSLNSRDVCEAIDPDPITAMQILLRKINVILKQ